MRGQGHDKEVIEVSPRLLESACKDVETVLEFVVLEHPAANIVAVTLQSHRISPPCLPIDCGLLDPPAFAIALAPLSESGGPIPARGAADLKMQIRMLKELIETCSEKTVLSSHTFLLL